MPKDPPAPDRGRPCKGGRPADAYLCLSPGKRVAMAHHRVTDWRRDGSGNRWRVWKGRMLFLFPSGDGRWRWSVSDARRTTLSEENFATEGEAEAALREALHEGPGEGPSGAEGHSGEVALW